MSSLNSAPPHDRDWEEPFDDFPDPPLDIHQMVEYCGECLGPHFESSREFFVATATMAVFYSNQLEGVGSPLSDTTRLINDYERNSKGAFSFKGLEESDVKARREVLQHFRALLEVRKFALSKQPLTENVIKEWHQILMEELVEPCGTYRTEGLVAGPKIFPYHDSVPTMMTSFVSQLNSRLTPHASSSAPSTRSLWAISAWASHSFVSIHPFADGNGRMCRLLANYVLWYCGFPFAVPLSCSRKDYVQTMRYADRDFQERRTGKLAFIILSNAHAIVENFNANQKLKVEFSPAAPHVVKE